MALVILILLGLRFFLFIFLMALLGEFRNTATAAATAALCGLPHKSCCVPGDLWPTAKLGAEPVQAWPGYSLELFSGWMATGLRRNVLPVDRGNSIRPKCCQHCRTNNQQQQQPCNSNNTNNNESSCCCLSQPSVVWAASVHSDRAVSRVCVA